MDLQYFPMDRQKCTIEIESCKLKSNLHWTPFDWPISKYKLNFFYSSSLFLFLFRRLLNVGYYVLLERWWTIYWYRWKSYFAAIQRGRNQAGRQKDRTRNRKLLSINLWNSIDSINGLLYDSNLRAGFFDRDDQLGMWWFKRFVVFYSAIGFIRFLDLLTGVVLASSKCHSCPCTARCGHCAHHDHTDVVDQFTTAQNLVRQIDRRVSRHMFRNGVRRTVRIRRGRLHWKTNINAKESISTAGQSGRRKTSKTGAGATRTARRSFPVLSTERHMHHHHNDHYSPRWDNVAATAAAATPTSTAIRHLSRCRNINECTTSEWIVGLCNASTTNVMRSTATSGPVFATVSTTATVRSSASAAVCKWLFAQHRSVTATAFASPSSRGTLCDDSKKCRRWICHHNYRWCVRQRRHRSAAQH